VSVEQSAKSRDFDCFFLEELRDTNKVLRPPDSQRICNYVLGAQYSRFDSSLAAIDLNIDVLGSHECFHVERACHRQELHRPSFDDNSFHLMLIVTL